MVLYLDCMCQCRLHVVLWLHISTLMHCLVAEHRSKAGLLFLSQCPSGTILWDWWVSRGDTFLVAKSVLFRGREKHIKP